MFYTHARHIKTRVVVVKSEQSHQNLGFKTISTKFLLELKFSHTYLEWTTSDLGTIGSPL